MHFVSRMDFFEFKSSLLNRFTFNFSDYLVTKR